MSRWSRSVDFLSRLAVLAAGVIMFLMMALIVAEILLRNLFGSSTHVAQELVGYGLASLVFLGLAHAFRAGGLVRMNLLLSRIKGTPRRLLEMLSTLVTLALTGLLFVYFARSVIRNYGRGAVSGSIAEIPLRIVEAPILLGLLLFSVQLMTYLAYLIRSRTPAYLDGE